MNLSYSCDACETDMHADSARVFVCAVICAFVEPGRML